MKRQFRLQACVAAAVLALLSPLASAVPVISIAPGTSPAGGYLPLSVFGIAPIGGMTDEALVNFTIPSVGFAGESFTRIGVVSNGYAVLGGGNAADIQWVNLALPNAAAPGTLLAPFWTDLDPGAGGAVRIGVLTDGVDHWLVVDWEGVRNAGDATLNSFQMWIGTDTDANPAEDVSFAYGSVGAGNAGLLTVGAQDVTRTVGATYYFNGAGTLPVQGTQLRVTSRDLPVRVPEPTAASLVLGALAALALTRRRRAPSPPRC